MTDQSFDWIKIRLEPFLELSEDFEGNEGTVLVDEGCNTKMSLSKFPTRSSLSFEEESGRTRAVITNSRTYVQQNATKAVQKEIRDWGMKYRPASLADSWRLISRCYSWNAMARRFYSCRSLLQERNTCS